MQATRGPLPSKLAACLFCASLLCLPACRKEAAPAPQNTVTVVMDTVAVPPGMVQDLDGHLYPTTVIGGKRWMAANLKTAHYANGDPIPYVPAAAAWEQLSSGAWSDYNNDPNYEISFGKFYNWYTVMDPRNVCPSGWHVPSDAEWQQLELALGMPPNEAGTMSLRGVGANVGGQLKALPLWDAPNAGADNSSGFTAYPSGVRANTGNSFSAGAQANWWCTTTVDSTTAFQRRLYYSSGGITRFSMLKGFGSSVRCVQD